MIRGMLKATKVISILMSVVLALSMVGVAFADPHAQEGKAKHGLFGTVTAKGESSFTVQTSQGSTVELAVTGDTKFRVPGEAEATFDSIKIGSRIAAQTEGEANQQTALKVMLVPGEPQREHRVLTVIEISGKTVIAEDAQGNRIEVELEHEPSADVKGQLVTFIGTKSRQSDRFKANVEVKIEQVVKRLETHAKEKEAEIKVEVDARAKAHKEREQLADLKARLEANMQRHLDLFAEVIAKAPEQAKASLTAALEMTLKGHKMALEALGESSANAEAKLGLRTATGTVESVDASANQIIIISRGDTELTLKTDADTKVLIGENAGALADISAGAQVKVRFNSDTMVATEIMVKSEAEVKATIQSVDAAKGELILKLDSGATLTLKLTPTTEIKVNDKKVAATDLKANLRVEVEYNLTTLEALEVEAKTMAEVKGVVKSVDAASGTVTITTESGAEVSVKVTDATRVILRGLLMGVLGISAGMEVEAKYDLSTGIASELKAKAEGEKKEAEEKEAREKATGAIVSINMTSGEVTINLDMGGTLTLKTDASTRIDMDGARLSLVDLEEGTRVRVEFNSETKMASRIQVRGESSGPGSGPLRLEAEVHGRIHSVDSSNGKVVLELRDGSLKELSLDANSLIRINGRSASASDLKAGMEVEARYLINSNIALRLNAASSGGTESNSSSSGQNHSRANEKSAEIRIEVSVP
ncbi:MAG: hypothetical protein HYX82_02785 [Chloroflexi bacterium]|nr:hypothetical protein [Chloroflexota bacterium]